MTPVLAVPFPPVVMDSGLAAERRPGMTTLVAGTDGFAVGGGCGWGEWNILWCSSGLGPELYSTKGRL
jgi:hypothetical protein